MTPYLLQPQAWQIKNTVSFVFVKQRILHRDWKLKTENAGSKTQDHDINSELQEALILNFSLN